MPDQERSRADRPARRPKPGARDEDGFAARFRARRRARKAAKKRRLAAMSRKRRVARRVGIIGTWLLALLAACVVAAVSLFYVLSDVPDPNSLPLPQTATIRYADGTIMGRIGSVNRISVSIDEVPPQVRYDILAAEDRGFYSEPGVSITGTLRAAWNDLTGGDTQGGSGIAQQYAKNAYLSDAPTLSRKLKELAIAIKLTREYSKDQILEFYLNTVYFGRGAYGIQAAAHAYFRKPVQKLDTAQGAVLAALLRAPNYYDPKLNPGPARERWRYVLDGMVQTGHLTQTQANQMPYPKVQPRRPGNGLGIGGPKDFIVQRVIAELQAHGISEDEIYARGLTIKTTINEKAQADAERAIQQTFAHLTPKQRNIKNALVAIDPKTGGVLAYYGGPNGKNYAGHKDYYDYAGLGFAPPGSSFKPYTLATALSQTLEHKSHITISSIVDGSYCVHIEGTRICNDPSDQAYSSSSVSVANAMKYSLNTTFDQMAAQVGPDNVAETAHAAGISKTINGKPSLQNGDGQTSFGIGIGDYPVHPIDQATGFATFANDGMANGAYFVQKATASDGSVVYQHKSAPTRAVDPKVANDVTLTLKPVAAFSGDALADGRISAAKTGTEGIQSGKYAGGNSDAWMVGYTPQVSTAVWVGSGNATTPIYSASGGNEYGRDLPGAAWKAFMDRYLAGKRNLPMATKQEIGSGYGTTPTLTTSAPPPSTFVASTPPPSPTFTISTGFSSPPPAFSSPPPPSTPAPTPTPPSPSSSSSPPTPSSATAQAAADCRSGTPAPCPAPTP